MVKSENKVARVVMSKEEYRHCLEAQKIERMPSFSSWARKVLAETSDATKRGLRK